MKPANRCLILAFTALALLLPTSSVMADTTNTDARSAFLTLFQDSIEHKRGLALHVGGQTIQGAVVRLIGTDAVELRNQQYDRIVVRIDRVDGVSAP